jgi:hypothetical protein
MAYMDKYERRRQRVLELIKLRFEGRQARFAEAIGRDANYVSRMLYMPGKAGKKRIAEDMRDTIERACHLTPGWLDMDPGTPVILDGAMVAAEPTAAYAAASWPFLKITRPQWESLSQSERSVVESVGLALLDRLPHKRRTAQAQPA